jgi:tetratricopeptide (TPR) repeat protein
MLKDAYGLPVSTSSAEAVAAFDLAVESYLKARLDARDHLTRALSADADFGLAHCLKGYMAMLLYKQAALPVAAGAARTARGLTAKATARERMHVDALDAWVTGDLDRLLAIWEEILAGHPQDVLAFRLAHYMYFWTGRARDMLASVERIATKWGRELPGYGAMLGCRCFALEECGHYAAAEPTGREAIDIDPTDLWAAHCRRPCDGNAGPAACGDCLARWSRTPLGGRQSTAASPLVAPGALPLRARRVRSRAGALRSAVPKPRFTAHPVTARLHHRRAERSLHAVPLGAAGRRCG